MKTFKFYQDNKTTIWERNHFEVEAETREEAIEIVKQSALEQDPKCLHLNEPIIEGEGECLFDTAEYLTVGDNGNQATTEVYCEDGEMLFDNCDNKIQL